MRSKTEYRKSFVWIVRFYQWAAKNGFPPVLVCIVRKSCSFVWESGKLWYNTDALHMFTCLAHSCDQKMLAVESPLWLYIWSEEYFFEISLFSKSLTRLPQAQITANVCSLTQLKMAFKYLNLLIIRNQLTVHSNRSLSRGLQTIRGAKADVYDCQPSSRSL